MKAAILFTSFGPYHMSRIRALFRELTDNGFELLAVRFANHSETYPWREPSLQGLEIKTLTTSKDAEKCSYFELITSWLRAVKHIHVALLPSYYPFRNLICLLICKVTGVKCVLMSESWQNTATHNYLKKLVKKFLISLFDSAIVGGTPHRQFYIQNGMSPDSVYTGYDTVDNDYFDKTSNHVRELTNKFRAEYHLPEFYFLSLGRMVKKKNLKVLIHSFSHLTQRYTKLNNHLVFVGSGELENDLIRLCLDLNLNVIDHRQHIDSIGTSHQKTPSVHFYGFRQIDENPIFYALSGAFILPSVSEEWGLVVNEAMACSTPVLVSKNAGCAQDLVVHGYNGFLFDPLDVDQLTSQLSLFEDQPDRARFMGKNSQKLISRWSCSTFATNASRAIKAAFNQSK
jgi:1,2-diacylglycerol 3-alpha-glucosyltransferase